MSAIPGIDTSQRGKKRAFGGEVGSVLNPPSGCPFHPRCPLAEEICRREIPELKEKDDGSGHWAACWKC